MGQINHAATDLSPENRHGSKFNSMHRLLPPLLEIQQVVTASYHAENKKLGGSAGPDRSMTVL